MTPRASTSRSNSGMEGTYMTKPLFFNGESYIYWKERFQRFIMSTNSYLWELIRNGPYIPTDATSGEAISRTQWTIAQKTKWDMNYKVRYELMCALSQEEFEKVTTVNPRRRYWTLFQWPVKVPHMWKNLESACLYESMSFSPWKKDRRMLGW